MLKSKGLKSMNNMLLIQLDDNHFIQEKKDRSNPVFLGHFGVDLVLYNWRYSLSRRLLVFRYSIEMIQRTLLFHSPLVARPYLRELYPLQSSFRWKRKSTPKLSLPAF